MRLKSVISSVLVLLVGASAYAQDYLAQIREVNMPPALEASWHRSYHSPMLQEPLESEGRVYIQEPSQLRWETLSPVPTQIIFTGREERGRFRMPTDKDFRYTVSEEAQNLVILTPLRRDLKQLFKEIQLTVNPESLLIEQVRITGRDGDWTLLTFTDIKHPVALPATLFQK